MSRPKTTYADLPPKMTARRMRDGRTLYYTQDRGRKIPLGDNLLPAIAAHHKIIASGVMPVLSALKSCVNEIAESDLRPEDMLSLDEIVAVAMTAKRRPGVYFLLLDERVVYVGQSKDVFKRITDHKLAKRPFDSFAWVPCPEHALRALEAVYISKFDPPQNQLRTNDFRTGAKVFRTHGSKVSH